MKIIKKNRTFKVGIKKIILKEVAKIKLKKNEMITFVSGKSEYDVVKKEWGYYATPSINKRLISYDINTCLIKNIKSKNLFLVLVHKRKKKQFLKYLKEEKCKIVKWLG